MQSDHQAQTTSARICRRLLSVDLRELLLSSVVIVWIVAALCSYRHTLVELVRQWQVNASYSHGAIVIPIALWLLWQRRSSLPSMSRPWTGGIGLLCVAHGLLWLGDRYYLPAVQQWTIPLWLAGTTGLLCGRGVLGWSLPGLCFLGFMIPLPFQLESLANQFLQQASAWCSCILLGLTSTLAVTDGHALRMSAGRVGITSDCSGFRMTIAVAAMSYVMTCLSHQRSARNRVRGLESPRLPLVLVLTMMLVIPVAIVANALRIAAMAFVMQRYELESWTTRVHDLGDWLVLPVSAILFLACKRWFDWTFHIWTTDAARLLSPDRKCSWGHRSSPWISTVLRLVAVPSVVSLLIAAAVWRYESQHQRVAAATITAAHACEAEADWTGAAACWRELVCLQPSSSEPRYRLARAARQSAVDPEGRRQALFQLQAVLERSPLHVGALRTHLDLALELNLSGPALQSAQRLRFLSSHDYEIRQMCCEASLRFSSSSSPASAISVESPDQLIRQVGPVTGWRDSFVIEVADLCCRDSAATDPRLIQAVGSAIPPAVSRTDSAKAHFTAWNFGRTFGTAHGSLDLALKRMDDNCPEHVAFEICLAAAGRPECSSAPEVAVQFLRRAIELRPADHRGYARLGDVYAAQHAWSSCTAARLRAWRLAGDRPLELGIELAESLIHSGRPPEAINLVDTLANDIESSIVPPARDLQLRLQVVQTRLELHHIQQEMQDARYKESLSKLVRCRQQIVWNGRRSKAVRDLLPAVETLQLQCLVRLGHHSAAARLFEDRARRLDSPAAQWKAAARAWRAAGDLSTAAHCYRNAVFHAGHSSDVWLEYVRLLKEHHGVEEAIYEVTQQVSSAEQKTPVADDVLAQAWEIAGSPDRAIERYRAASGGESRAAAALAIALARQGQIEQAIELVTSETWDVSGPVRGHTAAMVGVIADELTVAAGAAIERIVKDAVAETHGDVPLLLAAAEWSAKSGATAAARRMLQQAVAAQPENVIAANNLAMLLADEGRDLDQALLHIDHVLQRTGPVSEFLDTRGWILVQMNRADEALPWLTQAAQHSAVNDPVAHLHLATAYLASGDRQQARTHLELAQDSRICAELLNGSERRAWAALEEEFMPPPHGSKEGDS